MDQKFQAGKDKKLVLQELYIDPKILILDEATNSLDQKNEELVLNYIIKYKKDLTCIIISHDFNVLKKCDQIYYLKDFKFELKKTNNLFFHNKVRVI